MSFSAGNSGSPSYFPDGYNGSQLANIETISATRILTSSDRRIQILTPNGATRIVQLPSSTVLGEEWVFINPSTSSQSLTITSSNTATIVTIVPGSTIRVNALVASPSAPSDWVLNSLGNTVGPGSAVDNAIVRFDGTTGKLVQNSQYAIVDDNGAVTFGDSVTGSSITHNFHSTAGSKPVINANVIGTNECRIDLSRGGTRKWSWGTDNTTDSMYFYNATITGLQISSTGAVTLGPAAGGVTHTVYGRDGTPAVGGACMNLRDSSTGAFLQLGVSGSGGYAWFNSTNNSGVQRPMVFFAGATEIGRYSDAGAWTLGGSGGINGTHLINSNTSGAYGCKIENFAGATANDNVLKLNSNTASTARIISCQNGNVERFAVTGAGDIMFGNNGANGSISASGAWTLGPSSFAGTHQINGALKINSIGNSRPSNYQLAMYNTGTSLLSGVTATVIDSYYDAAVLDIFVGTSTTFRHGISLKATSGGDEIAFYSRDVRSLVIAGTGAVTIGKSGVSDTTENLVHGRLRPSVDSTYNLGYTNLRWTAVYCLNSSIQTASDSRLKQNIQPMSPTLNKICQLVPSVWEDKYESFKTEKSGFVAQELEQVFPELVSSTGVSVEGHDDIKHISLGGAPTVAILVKAIQELKAELDAAKVRIATLENA